MKRNIKLFLIMMIPLMALSACIFSVSPPAGPVSMNWGQSISFRVSGLNSFQWYLDNLPLDGQTGSIYTFKSTEHAPGNYTLKVVSTFSIGGTVVKQDQREWAVTIKSVQALVPDASSCADITNVGLVCAQNWVCSDAVNPGEVISQNPEAGTSLPAGSTVNLTLSNSYCTAHVVTVPAATSCASLNAAGFVCSTSTACSNEMPAGIVLFQDPPAGEMLMQGSTVNLILSSGGCTAEVAVPEATSCADIEAAGFICSRIRECSMTIPLDGVISQNPPAGFMAMPGSFVALTLSSGMCQATVPDTDNCEDIIAEGLVCNLVNICSNDYPVPGTFLSISPPAGTGIAPGATVTLTKSNGPCTVVVPEGATCEEIETLSGGWLTCSIVNECSDEFPAGTKLRQNPVAGTVVTPGTLVEIVKASGPCPVMLPTPANVSATDVILVSLTDPMLNDNLDNMIRVTWDTVSGAEFYNIYRSNSPIGTYTYVGRTAGTETYFNDMQTNQEIPALVLPPYPNLPDDNKPLATANLNAYEAVARPIVSSFKSFVYYKVTADTTDPAYLESFKSAYDEGRMDYTIDEFYTVMKSVVMGIPMSRLFINITPIGIDSLPINEYWYDNCGSGNLHLTAVIAGLGANLAATMNNFTESMAWNELSNEIDCSPSKRKIVICNANLTGSINLSMSGTITGYVWFTGNVAGKFNNIVVPITSDAIGPGTTTVIYNGQSVPGYVFNF